MKRRIKQFPEYLIYLLVFLLPLSTRYIFEDSVYSLYGLDIVFIILLIFFLINKKQETKNTTLLTLLGFFWVVNFFNLYWSGDKDLSGYTLLHLTEGLLLGYIVLRTKIDFKKLSWAWIGAGVLQSVLGMVQFTTQKAWACKWLGMAEHLPEVLGTQVVAGNWGRVLRAYGTFPHPNIMGMFLVVAILLCIYLYLKKQNKYLLVPSLVLLSTGLMLTLSRQAWLALGLSLLLILILYKPKKVIVKLISTIFLVGLIFSFIYPQLVLNRFDMSQSLELYSVEQRYEQIEDSGQIIKKYWPIGTGLGTRSIEPVHNIYLLIFSELGIFGLISFLMICGYGIYVFLKNPKNFTGIILIGLLFMGLFDHYLWSTYPFILIFWLLLATLVKKSEVR